MRVLLDECLPRRLKRELIDHDVRTAPEMGWASKRNGDLLRAAAGAGFEAFVTVDRKLEHQQNVSTVDIAVIVLEAKRSRLTELQPPGRASLNSRRDATVRVIGLLLLLVVAPTVWLISWRLRLRK